MFLIDLKDNCFWLIIVTTYWISEMNDSNIIRPEKENWEYAFTRCTWNNIVFFKDELKTIFKCVFQTLGSIVLKEV